MIAKDHPCLAGHFPNNPIVPGVVILDYVLMGLFELYGRTSLKLSSVKFKSRLLSEESAKIEYQIIKEDCIFFVSVNRKGSKVFLVSGSLIIKLEKTV